MDNTPIQSLMKDRLLVDEIRRRLNTDKGLYKATALSVPSETLASALEEAAPSEEPPPMPSLVEAIILEVGRPPLLVRNNTFTLPESDVWKGRLYPTKPLLERAIRSVGRVELLDHDTYPWVGTAWMVAEDIAITNRHVAMIFAQKSGSKFVFSRNSEGKTVRAHVDFKEEYRQPGSLEISVKSVVFIEDLGDNHPDLAFLRLEKTAGLPPPIILSTQSLDDLLDEDRFVAAIGYPARDSRNDNDVMLKVFGDVYDVKRFAPGKVTSNRNGFILTHDCSTLGGNSGSVIVDVETGHAVGLHFGGQFRTANYAVKAEKILSAMRQLKFRVPVPPLKRGTLDEAAELEEAPAPKPQDYRDKGGYSPNFLGVGQKYNVPLPTLSTEQVADAARITHPAGDDDKGSYILNYTHFSLAMNARRKMAYYTASNIDGNQLRRFPRADNWQLDPRIDKSAQAGPELYSHNSLDRGHLVRRLDPVWGSEVEARIADVDTFHYTNACPQHKDLNQQTWQELEDYILNNARVHNLKVIVFTGPVLRDDDPPYRKVQLPEEFWKVVIMVRADNKKLSATGYLLSQADLLSNLEEFAFGQFRTYQVSVQRIQRLTGLDFGKLRTYDPLDKLEAFDVRVIDGYEDITV